MKKSFLLIWFAAAAMLSLQAQNLFNPATTTLETWFTSASNWDGEKQSTGTYNNGTVTVQIATDKNERWKAQVKLHTTGIVLDAQKHYKFACSMASNVGLGNVTVKVFDDAPLYENAYFTLTAGDNDIETIPFKGGAIGNGVIVFDFGYALAGTTITISDIVLEEVDESEIVTPITPTSGSQVGSGTEDGKYTLVWGDYFDQGALNTKAWNIEVNADGGGNQELQYYCADGVSVADEPATGKHCLVLTAKKENKGGRKCTSGRINTMNKVYFTYGKVEASIKFPRTGNGLWPAYWMMGNDFNQVGWPACGETDIIEMGHSNGYNGIQDRYFNGASHWGPRWDQHMQHANAVTYPYGLQDDFHLVTCIWDENKISMYIDLDRYPNAQPYYEINIGGDRNDTNNPAKYFHKENFIIFNLAIGGLFPGITDINKITALQNGPQSMYVDYVLVYQRTKDITVANGAENKPGADVTALEGVDASASPAEKVLRDGQLLIFRDGVHYTVTGQVAE